MKKHLLFFIFSLFAVATFGQTKIYLDGNFKKVKKKRKAVYSRSYSINQDNTESFKDYFLRDSSLIMEGRFKDTVRKIFDGDFIYYKYGRKYKTGKFINGKKNGVWKFYNIYNNVKSEIIYKNDELIDSVILHHFDGSIEFVGLQNDKHELYGFGREFDSTGILQSEGNFLHSKKIGIWRYYNEQGSVICETNFGNDTSKLVLNKCTNIYKGLTSAEQIFEGGNREIENQLQSKINYPKIDKIHGVEGTVYLQFLVTENGEIKNLKVLDAPNWSLANAAMVGFKELKGWKALIIENKKVNVYCTQPIAFSLD